MERTTLATLLTACCALLTACVEPEPAYRAELLAFDPGLVGTWRSEPGPDEASRDKATVDLTFTARTLSVKDGRVERERLGSVPVNERPSGEPNAFVFTLSFVPEKGEATAIECKGFAISVDGVQLLTFQPSLKQLDVGHLGGLVLPVQQAVRFHRDGDVLTIRGPKTPVGWIPDIAWLDPPPNPPAEAPDLGQLGEGPRKITLDEDRFVEVFRRYGSQDEFWSEPATFRRVK